MTRFVDAIDRLFEELVYDAWRRPQREPQPRQLPSPTTLEIQLPIAETGHGDLAFSTEGQHLTVTVQRRSSERIASPGVNVLHDAEGHFQQTFTLPEGTELAAVEARFEPDVLRLRITLRSQSTARRQHP